MQGQPGGSSGPLAAATRTGGFSRCREALERQKELYRMAIEWQSNGISKAFSKAFSKA